MSDKTLNQSDHFIRRAALLAAVFIAVHLAFSRSTICPPFWGINLLSYYPWWMQFVVVVIAILLVVGSTRKALLGSLDNLLLVAFNRFRNHPRLTWLAISLAGVMFFAVVETAHPFLGDGQLYLNELPGAAAADAFRVDRAPLVFWILTKSHRIVEPFGVSAKSTYKCFSYLSGFTYLLLLLPVARVIARKRDDRILLVIFLLVPGYLQMFCGYVETYPILLSALLGFACLGVLTLRNDFPMWIFSAYAGVLLLIHFSTVSLLPSLMLLGVLKWVRIRKDAPTAASTWAVIRLLLSLCAMPLVFFVLAISLGIDLQAFAAASGSANLLPLFAEPDDIIHTYELISIAHLAEFLNVQLLVAQAPLISLFLLNRNALRLNYEQSFLLGAAAFPFLATFLANPVIGAFRDWDILSMPTLVFSIWMATTISARFREGRIVRQVGLTICGIASLHTLLWLGLNSSASLSEKRFRDMLDRGIVSKAGRSYGWETLATHYKRNDQADLSLEAYLKAQDALSNTRYLIGAGNAYRKLGQIDNAIDVYQRALMDRPDDAEIWTNLGDVYSQAARFEEAADYYGNAVALDPAQFRSQYGLCISHNALHEFREAMVSCGKAIALNPTFSRAHYALGISQNSSGSDASAAASWEMAIQLDPSFSLAYKSLAMLHYSTGKRDTAFQVLEKAVGNNPDGQTYKALGNLYLLNHRFEHAAETLQKSIGLAPGDAETLSNLGTALRRIGRLDDAQKAYENAIELQSDNAVLHHNLGGVRLQMEDKRGALIAFERAAELGSTNIQTFLSLGRLYLDLSQPLEAGHIFSLIVANDYHGATADIYVKIGDQLRKLELHKVAENAYEKAAAVTK